MSTLYNTEVPKVPPQKETNSLLKLSVCGLLYNLLLNIKRFCYIKINTYILVLTNSYAYLPLLNNKYVFDFGFSTFISICIV